MEKSPEPPQVGAASVLAVSGHPIHPMLVTFPIAFLSAALPADIAFLWLDDPFWARASFWLLAAGTVMGVAAGIAGTVELFLIPGIRRRIAAWNHFVASVLLLAVGATNCLWRLADAEAVVWPWGLALSALTVALVGFAGWLGGHLVFAHQIGIDNE